MSVVYVLLAFVLTLSLMTIILNQYNFRRMKTLFDIPTKKDILRKDIPLLEDKIMSDHTVFGMASATNRTHEENQDACYARDIPESQIRIVAISDGIGSSQYAKEGSAFVAKTAVELVSRVIDSTNDIPDFQLIFSNIQTQLKNMIETCYPTELPTLTDNSFGTTLILGLDYPDKFVAAYVGNGVIYHLSGFFAEFPKSICIPWNSVNVLNPHTIPRDGRETLYKFFCYGAKPYQYSPSVIQIHKDQRTPGDIFLLATDGIDSADQVTPVIDKQKNIYKPTSRPMDEFYAYLKQFLQETEQISDEKLQIMLEQFLSDMNDAEYLDDDSTLGVFISQKTVDYFLK